MAYLTIIGMIMFVLWPALVPAMIHGYHAIANLRAA
jgi:hypothetical protein